MPVDRTRTDVKREPGAALGEADIASTSSSSPSMSSGGIAFAPNVTPRTFHDAHPPSFDEPPSESLIFPTDGVDASEPSTSSRKSHTSRKKPDNYIPRPPNAFILFRSAFIRSRNVSTEVETNHSTLSKIIGMTWQNLPEKERQVWHRKAKQAEAEHRSKFPQYAFKPVHARKGGGKRKVREVGPKDVVRCAKIADFLVQGLKGKELDAAIKEFDKTHVLEIVTRFEAPITEESFARSTPAPESKKVSRKVRSVSSTSSRHSTPSLVSSSPSPAPPAFTTPPSFDMSIFASSSDNCTPFQPRKSEPSFDFDSFSFDATPSLPSFDPHSQAVPPLSSTFFHPASPRSNAPSLPHIHVTPAYGVPSEGWSSCPSPCSPSTSSMPSTPLYTGTTLPDDALMGYSIDTLNDHGLPHKSVPWGTDMSSFGTYHDPSADYDCAGQYTDLNNSYSTLQPEHRQSISNGIDYSSFVTLSSYVL